MPDSTRKITPTSAGTGSLKKLKKGLKKFMSPKDDILAKDLEKLESLQACKDASLTGDEETRLLAVCRLGEFGPDALDALDVAIYDESDKVRALAIAMIAMVGGKGQSSNLESYLKDSDEVVRSSAEFILEWLNDSGVDVELGPEDMFTSELSQEDIIQDVILPLRTSDAVYTKNDYSTGVDTLEFEVTIINEGSQPITDAAVELLSFPNESLVQLDERHKTVETVDAGAHASVMYNFRTINEGIEGEMITSVTFNENGGERVSARAGNCFVRSFFDWIQPLKVTDKEFAQKRRRMRQWSREHQISRDPSEIFEMFQKTMSVKNLYVFNSEVSKDKKTFMGALYGMGKGMFTGVEVSLSVIVIGEIKEKVTKLRLDIFSDNPEILHTAASEIYETTLGLLGEL
ncbi:MAG: HEAT repeat domain-containing protein [Candidatus Thorarchaeota archaeon]